LPRLTVRKHPQRIQGTVDVGVSASIWLEKDFDPRPQISPLSSFRIHRARKKSVRALDDRVAPSHLFNIRNNATRPVVRERADHQYQHCRNQRQQVTLCRTGELGAQAGLFSLALGCV
jgi:hypothetical protein